MKASLDRKRRITRWLVEYSATASFLTILVLLVAGAILLQSQLFPYGLSIDGVASILRDPGKVSLIIATLVFALMGGGLVAQVVERESMEPIQSSHEVLVQRLGDDYPSLIATSTQKINDLQDTDDGHMASIEELQRLTAEQQRTIDKLTTDIKRLEETLSDTTGEPDNPVEEPR